MPDKGVGPSQGLVARILAMIMDKKDDPYGGLTPNPNATDIYLPSQGPSMQERMDALMQPRDTPIMPSLGPTQMPAIPPPIVPQRKDATMDEVERLRKRNEMLGRLGR